MNSLKPFRSFSTSPMTGQYPALKLLLHSEDLTNGSSSWEARRGGITLNFTKSLYKDSGGVYSKESNTLSSILGTMPSLTKYVVVVGLGLPNNGAAFTGSSVTVGDSSGNSIGSGAIVNVDGSAINLSPSLTGSLSTTNKYVCSAAYFDMVDTTSPVIYRVQANNVNDSIPYGSGTTLDTNQIVVGQLGASLAATAITGANATARQKIVAIFEFASALSGIAELRYASSEMARTQELFSGWQNYA